MLVNGYTDYLHSLGVAKNPDGTNAPMPVDLVTGDFTGFDPDISEAGALAQVDMVAAARHLDPGKLRALVEAHLAGRSIGIFGAPHVNVLSLNMALDAGAAS
jgi:K+-transporting ATPase ATPase C chain